jgi:transposase-like protein
MITATDLRRFRYYRQTNKAGGCLYSIKDIARMEGVSYQMIYLSLKKFGDEYEQVKRKRPIAS